MKKTLKNTLYLLLLISICESCSTNKNNINNKVIEYLENHFNEFDSSEKSCILLLTEDGCIPCNREYAKFIQNNFINKENSYIILSASGAYFDVSPFMLTDGIKNVTEDDNNKFKKDIYPYSSAIFIHRNKIDTIIQITAKDIEKTFIYILYKYNYKNGE